MGVSLSFGLLNFCPHRALLQAPRAREGCSVSSPRLGPVHRSTKDLLNERRVPEELGAGRFQHRSCGSHRCPPGSAGTRAPATVAVPGAKALPLATCPGEPRASCSHTVGFSYCATGVLSGGPSCQSARHRASVTNAIIPSWAPFPNTVGVPRGLRAQSSCPQLSYFCLFQGSSVTVNGKQDARAFILKFPSRKPSVPARWRLVTR